MKETEFEVFIPHIAHTVYRKCRSNWRMPLHRLRDYNITYLIKGAARYTIDGIVHELSAGDMLFLSEGVERMAVTDPHNPMSVFSVNFSSLFPSARITPPPFPMISHIGLRQDLIDLFKDMIFSWVRRPRGYLAKSCALLMLLLHNLAEILLYGIYSASKDYRIDRITRYIDTHFTEKLTVKNLAGLVHLDTIYFGQLFRQKTGVTVHQYITQVRVRNAEVMLSSGKYKVHEVADRCRFSDVSHFYKKFKALRGIAPSNCIPKDG
ncbi:MAG: AraC family transcriptional regulator [Treponema sp.]|jgi:AraC-like DNA-binding protein|nr:AraC family transcriptional regulator [Treponema sp.]